MTEEEIVPFWEKFAEEIFGDGFFAVNTPKLISEAEHQRLVKLRERLAGRYRLNLGVFFRGAFVGWMRGVQKSPPELEMFSSAIFSEHRRRGLYTALVKETVRIAESEGFQLIVSSHNATNNAVLIPKLKAGFLITGMQVVDVYGALVNLSYYTNSTRRKLLEVRCGHSRPDENIAQLLGMSLKRD